MDDAHVLPRDAKILANKLQQVLSVVGKQMIGNEIKHNSAQKYTHRVSEQVNKEDEK